MPDIDPAALSRSDFVVTAHPSSLSLSKVNGVSALPTQKAIRTVSTAQRIDLEPLYTSLKSAIGDNWGKYKETISLFVLGMLFVEPKISCFATSMGLLTKIFLPRPPQSKRAFLPHRSLCNDRPKHRASP